MKTITFILLLIVVGRSGAQTIVDKTFNCSPGQTITMHFDYPELIVISSWEKNEVSVHGSVAINGGENDDAFQLINSVDGNVLTIRNEIKDLDNLPRVITITDGAKNVLFRSNEDFKKYEHETGRHFPSKSFGVDFKITLEIKVPRNTTTRVESVYGMVEVKNFSGPLTVLSTYGGVDAALHEATTGELSAETNYGEIYTNFTSKFNGKNVNQNFHTYVAAKPGAGPNYSFTSRYGNVYIRKSD